LHLGHVLRLDNNDAAIFDFDGDPSVHLSERRIKRCPLRDAVSMLISFGYATQVSIRSAFERDGMDDKAAVTRLRTWARFWYFNVCAAYLRGYWNTAKDAPYLPATREQQQILLESYLLERSLLDIRADIEDKPEFSGMPLRLILHLLGKDSELQAADRSEVNSPSTTS
jgi:maltose alpha-D-glucosyltransferase/alpha-amylase